MRFKVNFQIILFPRFYNRAMIGIGNRLNKIGNFKEE